MHALIIMHRSSAFTRTRALIELIARAWREHGHEVTTVFGIAERLPPADAAFLHCDLTHTPKAYIDAVREYPLVVNRRVTDISKASLGNVLLQGDDWSGPVIVKSNGNYGGVPDFRARAFRDEHMPMNEIAIRARSLYGRTACLLHTAAPAPWFRKQVLKRYRIYGALRDVPAGVWKNPDLVVERYRPERASDGNYILRQWVFLGDQDIYFASSGCSPIVKGSNRESRTFLSPEAVPPALRRLRDRLGFDYGKFDFALPDGEPVLFDANNTPSLPHELLNAQRVTERISRLSQGLDALVRARGGG